MKKGEINIREKAIKVNGEKRVCRWKGERKRNRREGRGVR